MGKVGIPHWPFKDHYLDGEAGFSRYGSDVSRALPLTPYDLPFALLRPSTYPSFV